MSAGLALWTIAIAFVAFGVEFAIGLPAQNATEAQERVVLGVARG